jgi:membrane protease YdiL (CAAX protease family)
MVVIERNFEIISMNNLFKEQKVPWSVWDVIYIVVFIFFLNVLISYILKGAGFDSENILLGGVVQIIFSVIPLLIIFGAIKYYYKDSIAETLKLKITRQTLKTYLKGGLIIALLIYFSSFLISIIIIVITQKPLENPYADYPVEKLKMISVLAILISPVLEEVFFRGFMQPAFCRAIGNIKGTLLVSLLFAFLHAQYFEYSAAMLIVINLSLILGFARLYYNSTVPCIFGHLLNNILAAIAVFMGYYA